MSRKARICIQQPEEALRRTKIYLCREIQSAWYRQGWNQIQAALQSGASRASISRIDNMKVDELTLSFLFRCLACAAPGFRILISTY